MDRCPFCGASVRSGARFCTSCGRRLVGAGDGAAVATAPAEQKNDDAAQGAEQPVAWDSVPTSVEPAAPANEDWPRRTPVVSADLWPSSVRGGETPTASGDSATGGDAASAGDEPAVPAWPSSPWSSWAMPPAVDEAQSEAAPVAAGTGDEVAASDETAGSDSAVAGPTDGAREVAVVAPTASAAGRGSGDALGRALGLVDELRALLPAVAGLEGVDVGGALAVLRAARSQDTGLSPADMDSLVAAVETARARPREIDALLGLAGSLEGLAVVVAAYQRMSGAIEEAVALLGGAAPESTGDEHAGPDGEA